eukprot:5397785-Amphidinium_carterae.1
MASCLAQWLSQTEFHHDVLGYQVENLELLCIQTTARPLAGHSLIDLVLADCMPLLDVGIICLPTPLTQSCCSRAALLHDSCCRLICIRHNANLQ